MGSSSTTVRLERNSATTLAANLNIVSPAFFEALGIALVRGRHFTETDVQGNARLAVVSQAMALRLWPGEDPIGRRFFTGVPEPYEIIGIARDVSNLSPGARDGPYFYLPPPAGRPAGLALIVRTDANHPNLAKELRELALSLDRNVTISIRTLDENIDRVLTPARLASIVAGALGLLSLGLVAIGVYGVTAYVVSQRTREIGIRMALGAQPRRVQRQMISEGLQVVVFGIALGRLLAVAASRVLERIIFGLSPLDLPTYFAVASLILASAALACWFPARRVVRINPTVALRCE